MTLHAKKQPCSFCHETVDDLEVHFANRFDSCGSGKKVGPREPRKVVQIAAGSLQVKGELTHAGIPGPFRRR